MREQIIHLFSVLLTSAVIVTVFGVCIAYSVYRDAEYAIDVNVHDDFHPIKRDRTKYFIIHKMNGAVQALVSTRAVDIHWVCSE